MPKITLSSLPVSGLFAVAKPSGPTSMSVVNDIKKLVGSSRLFVDAERLNNPKRKSQHRYKGKRAREEVKIGQGGTLDPLADGVLVVGIGKGTKRLSEFLDCVKVDISFRASQFETVGNYITRNIGQPLFLVARQIHMTARANVYEWLRTDTSREKASRKS